MTRNWVKQPYKCLFTFSTLGGPLFLKTLAEDPLCALPANDVYVTYGLAFFLRTARFFSLGISLRITII